MLWICCTHFISFNRGEGRRRKTVAVNSVDATVETRDLRVIVADARVRLTLLPPPSESLALALANLLAMSVSEDSTALKPVSKTYWKGKGRASANDFDDLNPTITYRHLLATNLGVRDPLRVIALCDSDAFYAACEQVRLGIDPALPLVVLQWDSLIAVNYPARKFGISRMDKLREAKKRCPDLVVVHVATYKEGEAEPGYWENPDTRTHKVSLDHYRRESMKIIQLFKEGLPTGEVGECVLL